MSIRRKLPVYRLMAHVSDSILVIAATVFHQKMDASSAGLFDAYDLIKGRIGQGKR